MYLLRREFGIEPEDAYQGREAWAMDLLASGLKADLEGRKQAERGEPEGDPFSDVPKGLQGL